MTITNNYGYNTNVPYTYGVSTTATTSSQTSVNNINVDDILWRFMEGDITALEELRNSCINYVQEGQDGEYTIKFFYNNKRYEVHCFTNTSNQFDNTVANNTTTNNYDNNYGNTVSTPTPSVVPETSDVTYDYTEPEVSYSPQSPDSVTETDDVETTVKAKEVDEITEVTQIEITDENQAEKKLKAEQLIYYYTKAISRAFERERYCQGIDIVRSEMDPTLPTKEEIETWKNWFISWSLADEGLNLTAKIFEENVQSELNKQRAIERFIYGEITQEEFESILYTAVANAIPKDSESQAVLQKYNLDLEKISTKVKEMQNTELSEKEQYVEDKIRNNVAIIYNRLSNPDCEWREGIYNVWLTNSDVSKKYEAEYIFMHMGDKAGEMAPISDWGYIELNEKQASDYTYEEFVKHKPALFDTEVFRASVLSGNFSLEIEDWHIPHSILEYTECYEWHLRHALEDAITKFVNGEISQREFDEIFSETATNKIMTYEMKQKLFLDQGINKEDDGPHLIVGFGGNNGRDWYALQ